jgi:hypothetical protein
MTKLLHYLQLINRAPIDPPGLWVAIVGGDDVKGGDGIVIAAPTTPVCGRLAAVVYVPGEAFIFGGDMLLQDETIRNVWGLDAVPPEIAGAYMKLLHLGKLS